MTSIGLQADETPESGGKTQNSPESSGKKTLKPLRLPHPLFHKAQPRAKLIPHSENHISLLTATRVIRL